MNFLISILSFIFTLGVIIFVHEFGHLIVARAFNVRVLAFSLGFGPRLFGFQRGETEYRVSAFPLGGYVKLSGEHPEEASDDPNDFLNKPRWQRILVYLAGPAMNMVLAVAIMTTVFTVGIEAPPRGLPPVVDLVAPNSAAAEAGLESGDRIVSIDGKAVKFWQTVDEEITTAPERTLEVVFERDGKQSTTSLTPIKEPRYGIGIAGLMPSGRVTLSQITPGSPAQRAGFAPDDEVLTVDSRPISSQMQLIEYLQQRPNQETLFQILRDEKPMEVTVTPEGPEGGARIGANLGYAYFQRYPIGEAFVEAVYFTGDIVRQTFMVLGKIFSRKLSAKSALSGPLEIMSLSGQQAQRGFPALLHFMAFVSVSIGILNLLPVPILDGGQITILTIESVLRRDLSMMLKERLAQVGFVLLMALMVTVLVFDVQKRFAASKAAKEAAAIEAGAEPEVPAAVPTTPAPAPSPN